MDGYWQGFQKRRLSRRRALSLAAMTGAGAGALAVVGCGDDDDGGQPAGTPGTAQAGAQPKRGGTLTPLLVTFPEQAGHNDPSTLNNTALHQFGPGFAWARLVAMKTEQGAGLETGEWTPVPEAAERWEQPDDTTYVFHLRKGVKYHNVAPVNGREWNADDVVFSFQRQIDKRGNAGFLGTLDKFSAVDKYTARLTTSVPDADFIIDMGNHMNHVDVPRELVQANNDDLRSAPGVGIGPWIFRDWQKDSVIRFSRNPDYYNSGWPYADALEAYRVQDPQLRLAAFRTKRVMSSVGIARPDIDVIRREIPDAQLRRTTGYTVISLQFPADRAPTNDQRVRQGLAKLLNRRQIQEAADPPDMWLGGGIVLASPDWDLPQAELEKYYAQDIPAARALFQQAGFNPSSWKPQIWGLQGAANVASMESLAAQLKQQGIDATIRPIDTGVLVTHLQRLAGTEHGIGFTHYSHYMTTNSDLKQRVHSKGALNGSKHNDPQLDSLIERQAVMIRDREGRKRLVQDIIRRYHEYGATAPLPALYTVHAHQANVKNYITMHGGYTENLHVAKIWLDQ